MRGSRPRTALHTVAGGTNQTFVTLLVIPAKAGTHGCHGYRPSPVWSVSGEKCQIVSRVADHQQVTADALARWCFRGPRS